jgi:hypothetical protein
MRSLMEADLETLMNTPIEVSTATKTVQTIHEAPAIITTITRDQIAVWGYRTWPRCSSTCSGFFVVDDHISPNLAVRGISGWALLGQQHHQGADRRALGGRSRRRAATRWAPSWCR